MLSFHPVDVGIGQRHIRAEIDIPLQPGALTSREPAGDRGNVPPVSRGMVTAAGSMADRLRTGRASTNTVSVCTVLSVKVAVTDVAAGIS